MDEAKRRFVLSGLKLLDACQLILSFGLATVLVAHWDERVGLEQFFSVRVKLSNCVAFASILLMWHMIFSLCGLYESKRLSARRFEIIDVFKAAALSSAVLAFMAEVLRITMVTPRFLVSFWAVSSVLLVSSRLLMRPLLAGVRRRGRNLRYVLVVGTNSRAIEFAHRIQEKPELGYRLLGFVDDDWERMAEFKQTGFPLVSDHAGFPDFLRRNVVDEVAMCLPLRSFYEHAFEAAALCEQHGILMRLNGDIFGLKKSRSTPEEFDGDPYVATYTGVRDWGPLLVKRILDIVVSVMLLLLLAPVFVIVALLLKFSSDGPIFFRQERMGLNKRRFLILKFRTMVPNAEKMLAELEKYNEASGPVFKIRKDPRITPIGKTLRRTSIDELPQLFNVLKGDMSLVGPRPLPVRDYEGFSEDWQRRRFSVRPGITCLWQVNGRSSIPFEQWMKLDLQYMDEWSLWLDLKILARTVSAVLKGSGRCIIRRTTRICRRYQETEERMQNTQMQDTRLSDAIIESRGDINLRDIITPLFRHKRLMVMVFLAIAFLAILAARVLSNTYEARMEVLVNRERVDPMVTTESTLQMLMPASAVTEEEINSEVELLKSRDVLEKVVLDNGLEEKEKRSFRTRVFGDRGESEYLSLAVKRLGSALKIETPTKTNLINVRYSSSDPRTAYGVLNTLATLYVEKHVAVHRPTGSYEFFAKEADKYRGALADSEARLTSFSKEQGVAAPDVERTNMALVVANSVGSLHQAEQAIAADEQRFQNDKDQMSRTPERSVYSEASNAADSLLQQLQANLLAAQIKRTQLVLKFDPSYPLVQEADQEIADTKAAITEAQTKQYVNQTTDRDPTYELLREDSAKTQADLAAQRATAVALKQSIQTMQLQMVDLDQKALKQADLVREAKANEGNYLLYLSKREQERASDALDQKRIANVAVAVPPAIPTLPVASLSMIVMLGFIAAVGASVGTAYTVEFLDSSFRTPREVIDILGIPLVAGVPKDAIFLKHTTRADDFR